MSFLHNLALQVPSVRKLHQSQDALLEERNNLSEERNSLSEERNSLLEERNRLLAERAHNDGNVFFHYNTTIDLITIMRRHAVPGLQSNPKYLTNFLGVLIDPKFFPGILDGKAGVVEDIPIPANWHADIAEWGAALRAVDLARGTFTVLELGCGWGCWLNNTGLAAKRLGLDVFLIGVEGDSGHVAFARESTAANGFHPSQLEIHHGIAAGKEGTALFPRQAVPGVSWGSEPIFEASDEEVASAIKAGSHDVLKMITLAEAMKSRSRIDLLHIDIQGGEADLVAASLPILAEKVAFLLIGTHSRQIEGRLFSTLVAAGWKLEVERPAILMLGNEPLVRVDGVQGWRNPALSPP